VLAIPASARTQDLVQVRLGAHEGAERVQVHGAGPAPLTIEERGGRTVLAGGGAVPARIEAAPGRVLEVGGVPYPGALRVEARAQGGLTVTNEVELEEYVAGVVTSEIAVWSAPPALVEAQAIAARTYALFSLAQRGRDGRLWDGVLDQVYRGREVIDALPERVRAPLDAALERSSGLVLVYRGQLLEALYHASCGGATARLEDVFGRPGAAPLTAVACDGCRLRVHEQNGAPEWEYRLDGGSVRDLLARDGLPASGSLWLRVTRADPTGRLLDLELGTGGGPPLAISLDDLRKALGTSALPGGRILGLPEGRRIPLGRVSTLKGRGRGHGVGMCQDGAREDAERGGGARAILSRYYPGAQVAPLSASARP
jgi:stage II sporulation protein D